MADYIKTACASSEMAILQDYSIDNCSFWDATIVGFVLTTPGTTVACIQDSAEVDALKAANKLQFVPGLGTVNDSTANTTDVPFPYGPEQITEDYTTTRDYEVPFYDFDNYPFWDEIKKSGQLGQCYYVTKSGVIFEMSSNPSITADWGANGNFLVVKGTFTYRTSGLDKPYQALGTQFGSQAT